MSELKPKHGEWWLGKWSGTDYNAVMQYNNNTNQWHENGLETFETEHSFKPVNRLYEKCDIDRLEQENAELREALWDLAEKFEHSITCQGRNPESWGAYRKAKELLNK